MESRTAKAAGVLIAIAVVLSVAVGPALAVAPTVDTETTDTSTTSDWTDGHTVTNFEANSSNTSYIEANFETDNASVEIVDPDTGVVHASNTSDSMEETNTTNNYYAWNLSHDELATMPMDAGENKSITVRFINDTSVENPDTTEITVYLENQNYRAVVYAGDEAAAGTVTGLTVDNTNESTLFGFGSERAQTHITADNVGIDGANTTEVTVIAANTSDADPFTDAEDRKAFGSYESGDFFGAHQFSIEGHDHAVFMSEAHEDVADGVTYATTGTVNGHDAYTIHLADDYEGETEVDVATAANDKYGFFTAFSVERNAMGGTLGALTAGLFLLFAARPEA